MKKLNKNPEVSVILPVYNSALYLEACLNSIYAQTYRDFEIIAVDDFSTDDSYKILRKYSDKYGKMRILRNHKNRGVSETAKRAIDHAKGQYLVRMDADDLMPFDRITKQIKYLKSHKHTVAVGGQVIVIDAQNHTIGEKVFPTKHEDIYKYIYRFVPVQQATLTIDREKLPQDFEYYRDGMNTAEEVELFFKLFQYGKIENMDETMLYYRMHDKNTSLQNIKETFLLTLIARIKAVFRYNYQPSFSGIAITFIQTIVILTLPQGLVLSIYRNVRQGGLVKFAKSLIRRPSPVAPFSAK